MRNKWLVLLISVGIVLPTVLPLLKPGFFPTHDYTHGARLVELHRALVDGHFPVRWSANFGFGYGMPLFNFYSPLFYYAANLFYSLGFNLVVSIKITLVLLSLASFLGIFYFVSKLWGKEAALVASTAFIYAPYRAVDIFVRGAFSELTGITFVAISLYPLLKVIKTKSKVWLVILSSVIGGLLLAHNIIALMGIVTIALVGLSLSLSLPQSQRPAAIVRLAFSLVCGLGLATFFLIPAFIEKDYFRAENLTGGFFHYSYHFLYLRQLWNSRWGYGGSIFGLEDDISFELGKAQLIVAVAGVVLFLLSRKKQKKINKIVIWASLVISLASVLLTSFKSKIIWDSLPLLQFFQFPWRFLSITIVSISLLAGATLSSQLFTHKMLKKVVTLLVVSLLILTNKKYFTPREQLLDPSGLYYEDKQRIQGEMSGVLADYIHQNVTADQLASMPKVDRFTLEGDGEIEVIIDRTHEFLLKVHGTSQDSVLRVRQLAFPQWTLYTNGKKTHYRLGTNVPTIELPLIAAETILISGKLEEPMVRKLANAISLTTALSLLGTLLLETRNKTQRPNETPRDR